MAAGGVSGAGAAGSPAGGSAAAGSIAGVGGGSGQGLSAGTSAGLAGSAGEGGWAGTSGSGSSGGAGASGTAGTTGCVDLWLGKDIRIATEPEPTGASLISAFPEAQGLRLLWSQHSPTVGWLSWGYVSEGGALSDVQAIPSSPDDVLAGYSRKDVVTRLSSSLTPDKQLLAVDAENDDIDDLPLGAGTRSARA